MTQSDPVASKVEQAIDTFGGLDCAFNSVASDGMGGYAPEVEENEWEKTIDGGYLTA